MPDATYRAVFFDLDGTLLPMEIDEFMQTYFKSLGAYVARFGVAPDDFMAGMKAGIKAMAAHEDDRPNAEAFWEGFFAHVDKDATDWNTELANYYEHEFGAIGAQVVPNPAAARAVQTLHEKGYALVLTTMPMFPRRAVEWRLTWAGVDPTYFARITTFENSTSVKPKAAYYGENLAAAGVCGRDVLMVGNNTVEDLAACALGADAFLITDHVLDPTGSFDMNTIKHGSMEDFAAWVDELPMCENPAEAISDERICADKRDQACAENGAPAAGVRTSGEFIISGIED